jgi:hypothetical protein
LPLHHRREFDPAEIAHGEVTEVPPPAVLAALPLIMAIIVNLAMSLLILPALDTRFLAARRPRIDAPRQLSRHRHGRYRRRAHRPHWCHRARLGCRIVLRFPASIRS